MHCKAGFRKIKNIKPDSLCVVNRNNHMMLAGSSKDDDSELGKELPFKILILHNKELKKWLVSDTMRKRDILRRKSQLLDVATLTSTLRSGGFYVYFHNTLRHML